MYFVRGSLPWQGLVAKTKKEKYDAIKEKKVGTPFDVLCKGAPPEFAEYLYYCHNLKFDEPPDYTRCKIIFKNLFVRKGYEGDRLYDWLTSKIITEKIINEAPEKAQQNDKEETKEVKKKEVLPKKEQEITADSNGEKPPQSLEQKISIPANPGKTASNGIPK